MWALILLAVLILVAAVLMLVAEITILSTVRKHMSELDDVKATIAPLVASKDATAKALTDIVARLTAIEAAGTGPAPGELEAIATQITAVTTALNAGAAAAEATP